MIDTCEDDFLGFTRAASDFGTFPLRNASMIRNDMCIRVAAAAFQKLPFSNHSPAFLLEMMILPYVEGKIDEIGADCWSSESRSRTAKVVRLMRGFYTAGVRPTVAAPPQAKRQC